MVLQEWEGEGVSNLCFVKTNNDASPVQSEAASVWISIKIPPPPSSPSQRRQKS